MTAYALFLLIQQIDLFKNGLGALWGSDHVDFKALAGWPCVILKVGCRVGVELGALAAET